MAEGVDRFVVQLSTLEGRLEQPKSFLRRWIDRREQKGRMQVFLPGKLACSSLEHNPDSHGLPSLVSQGRQIQETVHGLQTGRELVPCDPVMSHGNDLAPHLNFSRELGADKILECPSDILEVVKKLRKAGVMIIVKVGQEKALNMANVSLFEKLDGGCLPVNMFAVDERVAGFSLDLGFQNNGIAEMDVEHMDLKHLQTI
jgi:hypothetical protein